MTRPKCTYRVRGTPVSPSSRDSISGWLDVLTSMLSLPESKRVQVRDELEDHVRSRVDDLLITGIQEQEAIRIAVAELGETAELAKLISHAHTRANPRRRMMNTAMILVAITGLTYGGFAWIGAPGVPVVDSHGGVTDPMPVAAATEIRVVEHVEHVEQEEDRVVFSIDEAGFVDAFGEIAGSFGLVPSLSATMLKRYKNHNPIVTLAGEYTLSQAMDRLLVFDPYGIQSNAYYIDEGKIAITDPMVVIRRETSVKTYAVEWADKETVHQIRGTLYDVITNGRYSQFYNAGFIGGQLVINAREQAHEQIESILAESKVAYEANLLKGNAEFERTVQELQKEFDGAREALLKSQENLRVLESDLNNEKLAVFTEGRKGERDSGKMGRLYKSINERGLEVSENEERYLFLRTRLLESEYAQLFAGLE